MAQTKEEKAAYQKAYRAKYREKLNAYNRKYNKDYQTRNKDQYAATQRKSKYGLTQDEYDALKEKQEGKCAICGCVPKKLCVDHDHQSGKVRGLLCNKCNVALGQLNDDAILLRCAAQYIETHKAI
jgi:hypothetical protein